MDRGLLAGVSRRGARRLAARTATVGAAGAAGCALAGLLPIAARTWPLELISHFQVQLLLGSLACALVLGVMRRFGWMSVALAAAFSAAASVLPYEPLGPPALAAGAPRPGTHVRILLCNVLASNTQYQRVERFAEESGADILVMQEFDGRWQHYLSGLEASYPYRLATHPSDPMGMEVFSRIPVAASSVHRFGVEGRPTFQLHLDLGEGRAFTLVTTHPRQPLPPEGHARRDDQLQQVGALLAGLPHPLVLVGDLNTTMWSPCFKRLCADSGLESVRRGRGVLASWPSCLPAFMRVPIDHVLVSPEIGVVSCALGEPVGSDHLPVIVDLVIP